MMCLILGTLALVDVLAAVSMRKFTPEDGYIIPKASQENLAGGPGRRSGAPFKRSLSGSFPVLPNMIHIVRTKIPTQGQTMALNGAPEPDVIEGHPTSEIILQPSPST